LADYGTSDIVKRRLGIDTSITDVDSAIDDYLEEADEFINTRVKLMKGTQPDTSDAELLALGSSLAAALYTYWNSSKKDIKPVEHFKQSIVDHLKVEYSSMMDDTSQNTFSKTSSKIKGTE